MSTLLLLLLPAALAVLPDLLDDVTESDTVSLLQHRIAFNKSQPMPPDSCAPIRKYMEGDYVTREICGPFDSMNPIPAIAGTPKEADMFRPLIDVQREHPGNLYAYFGDVNQWINTNIVEQPKKPGRFALSFPGGLGREVTYEWDGNVLTTHMDSCAAPDDPYCYSLGWMKNQALDKRVGLGDIINDKEAMHKVGAEECARMKAEYGFDDETVTLFDHIKNTNAMYEHLENSCSWHESTGQKVTSREFVRHAYAKCFMNNATSEIGYCYHKACLLPGNRAGHNGECGYN